MYVDADDDAKVQNTKSQLEAALGAKFESLFGKMMRNVKYFAFSCNHVNILGLLQQHKSRFKAGVSCKWEKPQH
jgi:hypothetical protein